MKLSRRDFFRLSASAAIAGGLIGSDFFKIESAHADTLFFRPDLISDVAFAQASGNQLYIAGYPASWWETNYGIPLHVQYAGKIRKNVRAFKEVLKENYPKSEIRYAAKACTHPSVFSIIKQEGLGVDAASENEARCVLDAGIEPFLIDLNGNAKTDEMIKVAIALDMLIIANDFEDFLNISGIASSIGLSPRVLLRISGLKPGKSSDHYITTAGHWTKFGLNLEDVPSFFEILPNHPHIRFKGFHVHIGSQVMSVEPFLSALGSLLELCTALNERGGNCEILNLGGGYPVSYITKEQWEDALERIRSGYQMNIEGDSSAQIVWGGGPGGFSVKGRDRLKIMKWTGRQYFSEIPKEKMLEAILKSDITLNAQSKNAVKALKEAGEPRLVIEPGRSIVEDSGITLTRVMNVRKIFGGHNLITVNAGQVNIASAMSGFTVSQWENAANLDTVPAAPFEAFIAGHLCFSSDMLSKFKVKFHHEPKKGELLIVYNTGAYNSHFFAANTNSYPRPSRVIALEDGTVEYIKRSDSYEEIFSLNKET